MDAEAAAEWHIRVLALMEGGAEREFQVSTLADATLGDFRDKLATKSRIEPEKQRLIYHGRLLTDDAQKLADAGMRDGSAVHMVARSAAMSSHNADSAGPPGGGLPAAGGQAGYLGHVGSTFLPSIFGFPGLAALSGEPQQHQNQNQQPPWAVAQRIIRQTHRNFGADDGGEWIATNQNGQFFRIGREAEPGRSLTDDELRHGLVSTPNPISRSSNSDAHEPLPGVIPRAASRTGPPGSSARRQLARVLDHAQAEPSQALVNELTYDLFEYALPAIRAAPGNGDFRFGSSESLRPAYMSRASASPVAAAGGVLINLGDAFVELGRLLQAVGAGWQAHGASGRGEGDSELLEQQAQGALRVFSELAVSGPLAVPLLQARLARSPTQSQAASQSNSARQPGRGSSRSSNTPRADGQSMVSDQQLRIANSHARRSDRYRAFRQMVGASAAPALGHPGSIFDPSGAMFGPSGAMFGPSGAMFGPSGAMLDPSGAMFGHAGTATAELTFGPVPASAADPPTLVLTEQLQRQHLQMVQRLRFVQHMQHMHQMYEQMGQQMNQLILPQMHQQMHQRMQAAGSTTVGEQRSAQGTSIATEPHAGAGTGAARDGQAAAPRPITFMLAGETPEVIMERIDPPDANPRARVPAEAQASSQQQQQQQVPHSQGVNMGETHYRLFGMAAPPPTTPGPQSVRSDHSSGSMATEYSTTTVGDPATRVLHVFGPSMPGTQTQSIDSLFQQLLTRTGNPFSTASVFLGAEPGHAAHSSRRTSTSSSANSGVRPGSDAGTGAPGNAGARARGLPEEPARSAAAVPRTGNTRTRTLSSSSNGADAGVGSRGSVAGSSKRHRANDADGRPGEGPA